MKITTTLQLLRTKNMYAPRYEHLLKSLGAGWPDKRPINLLQILEYSGAEDALRALRAAQEPEADSIARLIAASCAETVLHIYEAEFLDDSRPRDAIRMSRRFATGKATQGEMEAAMYAASAAAIDAAVYTPGYAASAVASAAASAAAPAAAPAVWDAAVATAFSFACNAAADRVVSATMNSVPTATIDAGVDTIVDAAMDIAGAAAWEKITTIIRGYME